MHLEVMAETPSVQRPGDLQEASWLALAFKEQHILLRKTGFGEYIGKEFFKFKPMGNLAKRTNNKKSSP